MNPRQWPGVVRETVGRIPKDAIYAFGGYLLLAVVFLAPLLIKLTTHILADDKFVSPGESDAYTSLWSYWWIQKALLAGKSMLQCDWVLPPHGANLLFHSTSIVPSALTIPAGMLLGSVAGYNLMILLLLVGGAFGYYLFLSRTFAVSGLAAFIGGVLFGFCPYFLLKSHSHINLIGGLFWGGALGMYCHCYVASRFNLRNAILFACLVGLTFWTSMVEFFMLAIVLIGVTVIFEFSRYRDRLIDRGRRLAFLVPAGLTLLTALPILPEMRTATVARDVYPTLPPSGLVTFPRLSVLSDITVAKLPEYWGTYLPIVLIVLTIAGIWAWKRDGIKTVIPLLALVCFCFVLTTDFDRWPSRILRAMPMGEGFRVFARFLPFLIFFVTIFACQGLDRLFKIPSRRIKAVVLIVLSLVGLCEYYPAKLNPAPVKSFPLMADETAQIDRSKFLLVIPPVEYHNIHDTYQVSLDMRCVHLSYLAREDETLIRQREARFPLIYGGETALSAGEIVSEMRQLNIGYVLIEGAYNPPEFPRKWKLIARRENKVLIDVTGAL